MTASGPEALGPCPLCGRPMIAGPSVERHHWTPRTFGGRESAAMHQVCHRMVHRLFDEATLARERNTAEALRAHPDMARFLTWVRRQPPEYMDWAERPGRHGRKGAARRRR
ncbi:HNH endonuclease [Roseospira goensis]|uniref:HNH endonuclease n=1 Tax=Roseospira goensis TaxID=391922 RepID=A0A7W6S2N4_9PROT|nr:HNH endonuclease [Roseospira goensis]MBB4287067.1 hypothetical protein [Roseospira goensis]